VEDRVGTVDGDATETMFSSAGDPPAAVSGAPASFELAMPELESLVARMNGGRLPLEESLAAYQRGVALVRFCRDALGQVAQRVRTLEADLLQPFEAVADEPDA
jgi:exodeoxyribonuclease VII small subunit